METNKSSGSRRPAENADRSPSEVQYLEHHTTPGRAANNGYGFNNDLTPNSSDVPDPGPSDTVITDEDSSAIHERLLQEPLAPEALGPATLGHLSQSVASPAGHSIAQSSTSNQSPRRVQVGPPIVSQETCNGPHGRGGCMALV
ncbi:hypothetical protein B0T13DRAFT_390318 [Neurospora crassa]|nr:hypothetical protein B0T13DRAFT_390318 [Neurospora crassa]